MAVFQDSRYTRTPAYIRKGEVLILSQRSREPINLDNATYYTVIEGDTIDGIAHRMYDNAQLYWVILDVNPRYLSEIDIKAGDVILIPDFDEVVRFLG